MNFCSRVALASQEPCAGTGVRGEAYAFLPVPKRHWHDHEMNGRWARREELEAIRAARQAGVVTRLYQPPDVPGEDAPVIVYRAPGAEAAALDRLLAVFAARWRVDDGGARRLAICTHGTRDRCCAKFGFAAFLVAERLYEAGASVFEPMQCSHLGGDRFAATGAFFPSGSMYAHLDAADLAAVCEAEAAGRIAPGAYRGRVFDPPLAQLARAGLARSGLVNDAAGPIEVVRREATLIEAAVAGRRYRLRLRAAEVEFFGSCGAMANARLSRGQRMVVDGVEQLGEEAGA